MKLGQRFRRFPVEQAFAEEFVRIELPARKGLRSLRHFLHIRSHCAHHAHRLTHAISPAPGSLSEEAPEIRRSGLPAGTPANAARQESTNKRRRRQAEICRRGKSARNRRPADGRYRCGQWYQIRTGRMAPVSVDRSSQDCRVPCSALAPPINSMTGPLRIETRK